MRSTLVALMDRALRCIGEFQGISGDQEDPWSDMLPPGPAVSVRPDRSSHVLLMHRAFLHQQIRPEQIRPDIPPSGQIRNRLA